MPIELRVPNVGESITEVQIGEWLKSEGDPVARDENVVTIESEKATVELPAPAPGTLAKILKSSGQTARVGEVIAYLKESVTRPATGPKRDSGEKPNKTPTPSARGSAKTKENKPAPPSKAQAEPSTEAKPASRSANEAATPRPKTRDGRAVRVLPAAQRLLAEHGLRAEEVQATGPGGRLLKEDVLRHLARDPTEEQGSADAGAAIEPTQPRPAGERLEEIVPMSPLRRTVARRLVEARQTAALLTTVNEIDLSAVLALRREFQEAFQQKYRVKLGLMSFFVKASIEALKQIPQLNAEVREHNIVYHNYYDIGIAIGSGKGLVVPVVRNAERLSFAQIEEVIADFARRAQENKLKLEELQAGTFTISNGGVYGSLFSTPIVNPPQSGILGMHAIQDRPVAVSGAVVIRPMMYVALTYDHRIVDGREAVTFLRRIKEILETPARMFLEV